MESNNLTSENFDILIRRLEEKVKNLEKALLEKEDTADKLNLYTSIINSSHEAIISLDNEGIIKTWNPGAESLFNYKSEEVIGRSVSVILPQDRNLFNESYEVLTHGKNLYNLEIVRIKKGGTPVLTSLNASPIRNANGVIVGGCGILKDITTEKLAVDEANKNQRLFSSVLNTATNGIEVLKSVRDENNDIVDFEYLLLNSFAENYLKKTTEDLQGKKMTEEYPGIVAEGLFEKFKAVVESGNTIKFEHFYNHEGFTDWFIIQVVKLDDGIVLSYENITEKKLTDEKIETSYKALLVADEELRKLTRDLENKVQERTKELLISEERFRIAAQTSSDLIYERKVLTEELTWFGDIDSLLGFSPGKFPRTLKAWEDSIHPDDHDQVIKALKDHLISGETFIAEYRVVSKDGKYLYWVDKGKVMKDANGRILKWIGSITNVTNEKIALKALQEKEEEYRSLVLATAKSIWTSDPLGQGSEEVHAWKDYTGQNFEAAGKFGWLEAVHPEDRDPIKQTWDKAIKEKRIYNTDYRIKGKDGNYRYFSVRGVPVLDSNGEIRKWVGTLTDIDDVKLAQEALIASEKQYKFLSELIPEIIWSSDENGVPQYANKWTYGYTGLNLGKFKKSVGWLSVVHPDDIQFSWKQWQESLKAGKAFIGEYRIKKASDQQYYWHIVRAVPFKDETEKVTHWLGMAFNIHDRKKIKETLEYNEELIEVQKRLLLEKEFSESLLDNSVDGILAFDPETRVTAWNKTMEETTGIKKADIFGKKVFDFFPNYKETDEGMSMSKILKGESLTYLQRRYQGTGREGFFEANVIPLFDKNRMVIGGLSITRDVTARVREEEEKTKQKLFQQKQILTAILQTQEEERKRIAESLHNGLGQLLYAVKLNMEHLNIESSNKKQSKKSKENIYHLLEEAIKETRTLSFELMPSILEDFGLETAIIELCKRIHSDTFDIKCNVTGFKNRLKGVLEIAIYRIVQELVNNIIKHSDASAASIDLIGSTNKILVSVSDNGKGFDEQEIKSGHNGIGLKSIKNRVKLLDGSILINSTIGKGTVTTIEIPQI